MAQPKPKDPEKGSAIPKKDEVIKTPDYSTEETEYLGLLQKRLESARNQRSKVYEEFDGLTLDQYWANNERLANTELKNLKNKGDVSYQSGTLRTKMMAFLASYQGLNLEPDIMAYREDEIPITAAGNAMEDILSKCDELENGEELKMLRQYEMLKHGTVYVEDLWEQKWLVKKSLTKGFLGKIAGVAWKAQRVLGLGTPRRRIVPFLGVFLGDMTQYFHYNQPFIFTVETMSYEEAKQIYGAWERWEFVSRNKKSFSNTETNIANNSWRFINDLGNEQVEIVKYQDKPNNEYQIIINGVAMLPMGYPLTDLSPDGEYTLIQQNLEPIRYDFAIGKSFIFKNKNLVNLLDEMMKLAVLKTQKSFLPPYLNNSGRVVSRKIFMPGQITTGIRPGTISPLHEKEVMGVTNSEFNMIQEIIRSIDTNTASQTFTGAREQGGKTTATQIVELQRQARIMMGNLILAATLLEKKLTLKRIPLIINNWFDPIDDTIDKIKQTLVQKYRIVSRPQMTDEGPGVRMTILSEENLNSEQVMAKEDILKERFGKPFRITVLNPKAIKASKICWRVNVVAKEKKSSELSKMMFGAMVADAMNLGLRLNPDHLEQRFAEVWEEDPNKLFNREQGPEQNVGALRGTPTPTPAVRPGIQTPKFGLTNPAASRVQPAVLT